MAAYLSEGAAKFDYIFCLNRATGFHAVRKKSTAFSLNYIPDPKNHTYILFSIS